MMSRQPAHILLLEDSDTDAELVTELLAERGQPAPYRVDRVAEAIRVVGTRSFDVALLDLHVVDSRGLATLERFLTANSRIPVVVLSGQSDIETATAAVHAGAQDYIVKDRLDPELLDRALRHAASRHQLSAKLRESEQRYALAMAGAYDGLWDWDLATNKLFVSARWKQMLGLPESEVVEAPARWMSLVHPNDRPDLEQAIHTHCQGSTPHLEVEHRMRTAEGATIWVLTRGVVERDSSGHPARMAGSQTDITRYKQVEARLRHDATHDRLTGLPNRVLLLDRLQQAMQRRGPRGFALLFLDLDRFKLINDSLGHATGDRFLQKFVERVRPIVRPADTFARLGGDEFCILLDDTVASDDASRVAERLHRVLKEPLQVGEESLFASVSIGIADSSAGYERPEDMLRDADIAMYRAKARRRGSKGPAWGEEHKSVVERFAMETELRYALGKGEMDLVYQPIVSMRTGELDGFEALLRWHSPSRGLVGPETFIPIAKDTGILPGLGRWALRRAAGSMAELTSRTGARWSVSVNLSPHELLETDLVDWVQDVLLRTQLHPSQLVLEVTEDVLLDHSAAALDAFDRLKGLGVGIDLDDFGTGFSSLSHLRQFPVDRLKIDRSFVRDMNHRKEDREIIRAIVALGRTLGKQVVAEGIEDREQLATLSTFGCAFGQGFLFAPPGPLANYTDMGQWLKGPMGLASSGSAGS
jgi:diguanylate cyclase (GGDEF)-like protein/PAS domain S-box-containing protein